MRKTWKLIGTNRPDIHFIENPNGQTIASLTQGSGSRWQLMSGDMSTIINFNSKPSLARCLEELF